MFDQPVKIKMRLSTEEQVLLFVNFIRSVNFTNRIDRDDKSRKLIQKIWDGFYSPEFESLVLINLDVVIMLKIWGINVNNTDRFIREFLKKIFPDRNDDGIESVYTYALGVIRERMSERDATDSNLELLFDLLIEFEGSVLSEIIEKHFGSSSPEMFSENVTQHLRKIFIVHS